MKRVVMAALSILAVSYGLMYGKRIIDASQKIEVGVTAPGFELESASGKRISLMNLKGKVILLDFWLSSCGGCKKNHEKLAKLYDQYRIKGFEIVSISLDKQEAPWKKAIERDKMTWINLRNARIDREQSVAQRYGVMFVPTTFILDEEGKVIGKDYSADELETLLKSL